MSYFRTTNSSWSYLVIIFKTFIFRANSQRNLYVSNRSAAPIPRAIALIDLAMYCHVSACFPICSNQTVLFKSKLVIRHPPPLSYDFQWERVSNSVIGGTRQDPNPPIASYAGLNKTLMDSFRISFARRNVRFTSLSQELVY